CKRSREAEMSELLTVSTRKGLFILEREAGGDWQIRRTGFLGDSVSLAYWDSETGRLYAALKLGHFGAKLHVSQDHGASWREIACPAFPKTDAAPESEDGAPSVREIWTLAAGPDGALWAGTIGGGLFRSADGGASWALAQGLWDRPERANWMGGGNEAPAVHSLCIDPKDDKHMALAVSCGGVWQSGDSGQSWSVTSSGLYAEFMPPERREDPAIQDVHQMVQCRSAPQCFWLQHHNGVFRSTDGASSWQEVTAIRPSKFGFAVAVHPENPDRA